MPVCELYEPFLSLWQNQDPFAIVSSLPGEEYRKVKNRRTFRSEFDGRGFFIKYHRSTGWKEIFKNLFQFKIPVTGAVNEVMALKKLRSLQVPTMDIAAYAWRNCNPARRESFIITPEITDALSLETMVKNPLPLQMRRQLIRQLAHIIGTMHRNGINHRDCYLCHFLWQEKTRTLFVIDLHRAQLRKQVPRRYLIKDLAGLFFSALDMPLKRSDVYRFIREYSGNDLRDELQKNRRFWRSVRRCAHKLYGKEFGVFPEKTPFR